MGFIKRLVLVLVTLVVVLILVAGYLGFVPVLSKAFGSNKPRDLGVAHSVEAGFKGATAMNLPVSAADLEKIAKNSDLAKSFNGELSDVEASSLVLLRQTDIDNFPVYLTTFKFNPDNTAEAAGMIRVANVGPFLRSTGVSKQDADTVVSTLKLVQDAPFYLKGKVAITNNRVNLDVSQVELGRLPLPASLLEPNKGAVESYVGNALGMNGFQVKTFAISNGKAKLEGTRPLKSIGPWVKTLRLN